jgi:hypothetical protein
MAETKALGRRFRERRVSTSDHRYNRYSVTTVSFTAVWDEVLGSGEAAVSAFGLA